MPKSITGPSNVPTPTLSKLSKATGASEPLKTAPLSKLSASNERAIRDFDKLPASAFVRVQVVAAIFSISAMSVWRWSKDGRLPKPYHLSGGVTAWKVGELRRKLARAA